MSATTPSEPEDAFKDVVAAGFNVAEFQFQEAREPPQPMGVVYAATGTVSGSRTQKGQRTEKRYAAGHGTAWVVEFMQDLRAGVFGRP